MEGGAPATLGEDAISVNNEFGAHRRILLNHPSPAPSVAGAPPSIFPLREDNPAYPMPNTIGVSRAGFGVPPKRPLSFVRSSREVRASSLACYPPRRGPPRAGVNSPILPTTKFVRARRPHQHARRVRYPAPSRLRVRIYWLLLAGGAELSTRWPSIN